jgi:hypothetical protein
MAILLENSKIYVKQKYKKFTLKVRRFELGLSINSENFRLQVIKF